MPSIDSDSRPWRARKRMRVGRGRSGWIVWLITTLLCVQMWGLQHEIAHARELSGVGQPTLGRSGAPAATNVGQADVANSADDGDTDDDAIAADWSAQSSRTTHAGFGTHHHHCHLFEGATLAAAMAVAVLQWAGDASATHAPLQVNGRSHASAVVLPFDSRAPPVTV
ncbi:hypothetical protein MB84_05620 [Pandoraea oxalativorans]|uniref:DUF2946 domain-containing protein n=2 Tax=Pandoraea oxalativorans TaxID=573737 RepID=A0A0E3U5Z5_9BURK|nr:hypothetical protein MB84_05620 [Pandoraea oxalativorans]